MSRRFTDADALRWLGITLAIDQAVNSPDEIGVAGLVTPKSWIALGYVATRPGGTAKYADVRDRLRLVQSTMTRVVKVLEAAGYVTRSFDASTGDLLLKVTTEGRNALGEVFFHASKSNV
jgi:DNA-binding MarR family transcriptional regulator